MDREKAFEIVLDQEPTFLAKAPAMSGGHPTYVCPSCGNGTGEDGTGIAYDTNGKDAHHPHWKCFRCGIYADVPDLWMRYSNITDKAQAFAELYKYYGLEVDPYVPFAATEITSVESRNYNPYTLEHTEHQKPDDLSYISWAAINIDKTDYLTKRGISQETCRKYRVGYDPDRYIYKVAENNWIHVPVITVPIDDYRHCWRSIVPLEKKYRPHGKYTRKNTDAAEEDDEELNLLKAARDHGYIWNYQVLSARDLSPVYVVEGEIDALSIIEAGGVAVSLGGLGRLDYFLKYCIRNKVKRRLVVALDNDAAGAEATRTLQEKVVNGEIKNLNVHVLTMFGECKDANDYLVRYGVEGMQREFSRVRDILAQQHVAETSALSHLKGFVDNLRFDTPACSTGFPQLDFALDGGLYQGLYVLGAISSLGKTAFVMQIADQIASHGQDVYIISLEMGSYELIARSISRHTIIRVEADEGYSMADAKTYRGITDHKRYAGYSVRERSIIQDAVVDYSQYASHVYIKEGIGDINAEDVRALIQEHIELTGVCPIVVVDYVQILAPYDIHLNDKQNMDKNILELKRISRDYKATILVISSFNRESYRLPVSMSSYKESGAIEYSSDVLIGLQLHGVEDTKNFNVDNAKAQDPRLIDLKILKNRNAATGLSIGYRYYPKFSYFKEGLD